MATDSKNLQAELFTDCFVREIRVNYLTSDATAFPIKHAADVARFVRSVMVDNSREQFIALYLDGSHRVACYSIISIGGANHASVHPREVFQRAILSGAVSVVVAHNHPSGSDTPSEQDLQTTKKLKQAGELLGIPLLDHVIVTDTGNNSLRQTSDIW